MLTSNINFLNFKSSKKIKGISKKIKKFKNENFLLTTPLLKSFSQNYKYSYDRKIIKKLKNKKFFKIIGMGGSILGAKAIYFFLKKKIKKKFIFIDNLNPKVIKSVKAVNIIISKSGETLETISNFHALKIKKKDKNVFITENNNNYLLNLAKNIKADIIDHRNYIGGRYSVLSEVGMLPAELMGLKEKNFKKYNYLIKNNKFIHQLVYNVENTLNFIKKDKMNSVILNYDDCSESLFRWYQQLISESLGKKSKGLIPMISQMPTDNHSLLQLYLDGPKKNFFTFYSVINDKTDIVKQRNVSNKIQYIENKSLNNIISAQKQATQNVFLKKTFLLGHLK